MQFPCSYLTTWWLSAFIQDNEGRIYNLGRHGSSRGRRPTTSPSRHGVRGPFSLLNRACVPGGQNQFCHPAGAHPCPCGKCSARLRLKQRRLPLVSAVTSNSSRLLPHPYLRRPLQRRASLVPSWMVGSIASAPAKPPRPAAAAGSGAARGSLRVPLMSNGAGSTPTVRCFD
jgi:hypothetical protein